MKRSRRFIKMQMGAYKVEVLDYRYTARQPVSVRVSGTREGECINCFGEPCYFYKSDEAMSLAEGLSKAKAIVAHQVANQEG